MGLEQFEHLLPEQGLQVSRAGLVGLLKSPLSIEAAVRGNNVQVRDGLEDIRAQPFTEFNHPFLMAVTVAVYLASAGEIDRIYGSKGDFP